ncbi:MAG TPA: two-component regulator propeller domain-containing protein [Thermoanaerobaculia bacterium]
MGRRFPFVMRMPRLRLLAAAAAALAVLCAAPLAALEPDRPLSHYGLRHWTTDSGLPQNTVAALVQTRNGYLWMGTQDGLVRFDGVRFTVFTRRNTPGLPDDWVQALAEAPDGTLWIGTVGGLARYKDGVFEHWKRASALEKFLAQHILPAPDGTIWVGTNRGLLEINGESYTVHGPSTGLPAGRVRAILRDKEGDMWAAGVGPSLFRRHGNTWSQVETTSQAPVTAMVQTPSGDLWIAAGLTLLRWDGLRFTSPARIESTAQGNFVRAMRADVDGTIWVATTDALWRFQNGRLERYASSTGIVPDGFVTLLFDREGSLWAGSMDGGLLQLSDRRVTSLGPADGLADEKMWTVFTDRDGTIWSGSAKGQLSRRAPGAERFESVANFGSPILAIDQDAAGALWVGTQVDGLKKLEKGRWSEMRRTDGLSSNWISGICATCPGGVWVASMGGGLTIVPEKGATEKIFARDGRIPSDAIFSLAPDPDGSVWVGTFGGGLSHIRGTERRIYTVRDGLAHDIVAAIVPEKDGTVWVGTRGGLSRLKDGRWTTYRSQDGLFYDAIQAMVDDGAGHLWMSSTAGIFRVDKNELHAFAEGRVRRITSLALGVADGMRNAECNNGPHGGTRGKDGQLYFATMKGIASVDPSRVSGNPLPPQIALERIVVNGETHPGTARLDLPPGRRNVEFHYAGLSYRQPQLVRFRYRLVGFDETWRDAAGRRVAYYTNIPPGNYRFEVQAANESGVWSPVSASGTMSLARPFTQTIWFYLLCALPLIAAGIVLHRLRLARIEARERLRTALVEAQLHALQSQLRPHFLFNTLNTILPLIGRDPDRARRMVLQLGDLLRLSLKSQTTQLLSLDEELHILGLYLGIEQTRFRGLEVTIEVDPDVRDALVPGFLLQPLVENAIKHGLDHRTSRGRIALTARADGNRLSLRIRDAGPGYRPPETPTYPAAAGGIGLANTRSRLEKLYPERHAFEISNPPGGGCEVWISIPLERQPPVAVPPIEPERQAVRAANLAL